MPAHKHGGLYACFKACMLCACLLAVACLHPAASAAYMLVLLGVQGTQRIARRCSEDNPDAAAVPRGSNQPAVDQPPEGADANMCPALPVNLGLLVSLVMNKG